MPYGELINYFGTGSTLTVLFAGAAWFFFWRMFTRMEKKVDEQSGKVDSLLSAVVTKAECNQKHDTLLTTIMAMFGMSNCRNCGRSNDSKMA